MATDNSKVPVEAQRGALGAGPFAAAPHQAASRRSSLAPGASLDLALLNLASSASADLRYRRAESLLPCGLTQDELHELLGRLGAPTPKSDGGRHEGGAGGVAIGGGVVVTEGGAGGTGSAGAGGEARADDVQASG